MTNILDDYKHCIECGLAKRMNQFYQNKCYADNHVNRCIKCMKCQQSKREKAPSEISIAMNQWAANTIRSENHE